MSNDLNWQNNYHFASLKNRTHMVDNDIKQAINYFCDKYKIDKQDALKKLINYAIDGKLVLKKVTEQNISSIEIKYKLINLNDL